MYYPIPFECLCCFPVSFTVSLRFSWTDDMNDQFLKSIFDIGLHFATNKYVGKTNPFGFWLCKPLYIYIYLFDTYICCQYYHSNIPELLNEQLKRHKRDATDLSPKCITSTIQKLRTFRSGTSTPMDDPQTWSTLSLLLQLMYISAWPSLNLSQSLSLSI